MISLIQDFEPQNPEFRNNPGNFHPGIKAQTKPLTSCFAGYVSMGVYYMICVHAIGTKIIS